MIAFVVIGAGGHAKVVVDLLLCTGAEVRFLVDSDPARHGSRVGGALVAGGDDRLNEIEPSSTFLALGLGTGAHDPAKGLAHRRGIAAGLEKRGFRFPALVHPAATISNDTNIGDGAQIMAGAVVQPGTRLGRFSIINTRASVDHDNAIADGAHVAPGATLGGGVSVGRDAFVGIGAAVVQGTTIGDGAVVGAGAAVIADVAAGTRVAGVPAREII